MQKTRMYIRPARVQRTIVTAKQLEALASTRFTGSVRRDIEGFGEDIVTELKEEYGRTSANAAELGVDLSERSGDMAKSWRSSVQLSHDSMAVVFTNISRRRGGGYPYWRLVQGDWGNKPQAKIFRDIGWRTIYDVLKSRSPKFRQKVQRRINLTLGV